MLLLVVVVGGGEGKVDQEPGAVQGKHSLPSTCAKRNYRYLIIPSHAQVIIADDRRYEGTEWGNCGRDAVFGGHLFNTNDTYEDEKGKEKTIKKEMKKKTYVRECWRKRNKTMADKR